MSTAASGTVSRIFFVASSPSMPGMRTSMITTSGRRRSTSATAPAPSEASPITRMCGARESERRRPSRTTSWSSTNRQVISSGTAQVYWPNRRSYSERQLLGLRRRCEQPSAAVADAMLSGQGADLLPERIELGAGKIRRAGVQLLVVRELLRPVARERLEEVLLRPRLEVEQVRPDPARARGAGRLHHGREL